MAKAALEALMATLAAEEGATGVRSHVVAPGLVDTDQGRGLVRSLTGGSELHEVEHRLPGGRATTPADVAAAVVACRLGRRPCDDRRSRRGRRRTRRAGRFGRRLRGEPDPD